MVALLPLLLLRPTTNFQPRRANEASAPVHRAPIRAYNNQPNNSVLFTARGYDRPGPRCPENRLCDRADPTRVELRAVRVEI